MTNYSAYKSETEFLAALLAAGKAENLKPEEPTENAPLTARDRAQMLAILDRLRAHNIRLSGRLRHWKAGHERETHPLARRYSGYEGMLCRQDMQQHWLLYRYAMREYEGLKKSS